MNHDKVSIGNAVLFSRQVTTEQIEELANSLQWLNDTTNIELERIVSRDSAFIWVKYVAAIILMQRNTEKDNCAFEQADLSIKIEQYLKEMKKEVIATGDNEVDATTEEKEAKEDSNNDDITSKLGNLFKISFSDYTLNRKDEHQYGNLYTGFESLEKHPTLYNDLVTRYVDYIVKECPHYLLSLICDYLTKLEFKKDKCRSIDIKIHTVLEEAELPKDEFGIENIPVNVDVIAPLKDGSIKVSVGLMEDNKDTDIDYKVEYKLMEEFKGEVLELLGDSSHVLEYLSLCKDTPSWKVYAINLILNQRKKAGSPNSSITAPTTFEELMRNQKIILQTQNSAHRLVNNEAVADIMERNIDEAVKRLEEEEDEKQSTPAPDTKTRPDHYDNGDGKKQIWDYNHVLDGHQANILKYLNRIGKKKGESITDDAKKISAYMEKAYDAKHRTTNIEERIPASEFETLGHLKMDIMSNIPRYGNPFFHELLSLILLKRYHDALVKFETWYQSLKELNIDLR